MGKIKQTLAAEVAGARCSPSHAVRVSFSNIVTLHYNSVNKKHEVPLTIEPTCGTVLLEIMLLIASGIVPIQEV